MCKNRFSKPVIGLVSVPYVNRTTMLFKWLLGIYGFRVPNEHTFTMSFCAEYFLGEDLSVDLGGKSVLVCTVYAMYSF